MRLFTEAQHKNILTEFPKTHWPVSSTATWHSARSRQIVAYWRKIFIDNDGNMGGADRELKEARVLIKPQPDDDFGDTSFLHKSHNCIMVIPDIHAYQHPDALAFLRKVKQAFDPDLTVSLGDELDYHAMSFRLRPEP